MELNKPELPSNFADNLLELEMEVENDYVDFNNVNKLL